MLTIKAFINDREIDCIDIHNTSKTFEDMMPDINEYEVLKPLITEKFYHLRGRGWKPLAVQVLKHLISLEEK